MRILISLLFLTTPAFAHVGHVGGMAGHDHWIAGIAIGIAIGVSIWGALKGRKDDPEEEIEETGEEETA
jgi:hypothetical protein